MYAARPSAVALANWRPKVLECPNSALSNRQLLYDDGQLLVFLGERMAIRLSMDGVGAEDELRSLREWLQAKPEIRRHAVMSWEAAPPQGGRMGAGGMDWLQLITDNGWNAANFAMAYVAWRRTRRLTPTVTIECNGLTVTVDGADAETVARISRALTQE
ncbi:effector-associated constant component EACC1 [Kitasatospora purpeofusca]|uniref:effector-associated constant component EACC1 n=1 Tax=Kitasatospora purpeofusca TaxID=67352 RepID=UPI0036B4E305